jgi:hypothetical protein
MVGFCGCKSKGDRVDQLLRRDRLFLSTAKQLEQAFTFELLEFAELHLLEGKCSVYHVSETLRRRSDNVRNAGDVIFE